jgi:drug/metabolite transporter (DMT)-like permease
MRKSYLFAGLTVLFWATIPTAFKIALRHLDFIELLFVAILTTLIFLLAVLVIEGRVKEIFSFSRKQYTSSVILGFLNPFAYYLILLKAYSLLPAQIAQPLNFTWPIVLVFLSIPILKQKITSKNIIALLLSFVGVYFISSEGDPFNLKFAEPLGIFLAVGSSVIWALFWIFNVKDQRDEVSKLFLNFFFALVFLLPVYIIFSEKALFKPEGLFSGLYVGLFEMGITFVLWLKALRMATSTAKISNLIYLTPFFSLIFVHFILGEQIHYTTIVGIILVVSGIILQEIKKKKLV